MTLIQFQYRENIWTASYMGEDGKKTNNSLSDKVVEQLNTFIDNKDIPRFVFDKDTKLISITMAVHIAKKHASGVINYCRSNKEEKEVMKHQQFKFSGQFELTSKQVQSIIK